MKPMLVRKSCLQSMINWTKYIRSFLMSQEAWKIYRLKFRCGKEAVYIIIVLIKSCISVFFTSPFYSQECHRGALLWSWWMGFLHVWFFQLQFPMFNASHLFLLNPIGTVFFVWIEIRWYAFISNTVRRITGLAWEKETNSRMSTMRRWR